MAREPGSLASVLRRAPALSTAWAARRCHPRVRSAAGSSRGFASGGPTTRPAQGGASNPASLKLCAACRKDRHAPGAASGAWTHCESRS